MSAGTAIFERIHLPKDQFEVHVLEWLTPLNAKESLASYVDRFSKDIQHTNPILVGVSFGGIIAQELAKKIPFSKIVLISSIKHHQELRPFFKLVKTTKLYVLYPTRFINGLEKTLYQVASQKTKRTLNAYRKFLPVRSPLYTKWAIHTFLNWKQTENQNVIQLHGDKDQILPIKYISNALEIKNGTHAMILTKSSVIQQYLLRFMA